MSRSTAIALLAVSSSGLLGCSDDAALSTATGGEGGGGSSVATTGSGGAGGGSDFDWGLPPGYPVPKVPADNPMTTAKVELGRRLFYDVRLSGNQTFACATCHKQELAFTDGRAQGLGSTGALHPRGPMSVVNAGYLTRLAWANPLMTSLEKQALVPMFGETPVELGLAGKEDELLSRLSAEPVYAELFPKAFPGQEPAISLSTITRAISAFERSILSYRSPYDRYAYGGDPKALSESARRGKDLFFAEKLECFHCHGGFNFSDSVSHEGTVFEEAMFHNTGLYNIGGDGSYPPDNTGTYEITGIATDMGRFRAPTLRNIALTAPYMHDGSVATLDEALDHYAAGGRTIVNQPFAGVGSENPHKSELISGFDLSPEERADLKAFLESLTDVELTVDPRWSNPWGDQ
jgi:cytochrome c peroxidase